MHAFGRHRLAGGKLEHAAQHGLGALERARRAGQLQTVAAPAHVDAEALLHVTQVLLHRSREVREPLVVRFRE